MDDLEWSNWRIEHYKSVPYEQHFAAPVTTFAYKPGKESNLVVGLENGSLLLFDLSREKPGFNLNQTISDHKAAVTAIQFTEKYLITGDENATIRIYDLKNKKLAYSFQEEHSIENLETDGKILICGDSINGKIKMWNMDEYASLKTIDIPPCKRICTKINKTATVLLVAHSNGLIEVWDLQNSCKITSANINIDKNAIDMNRLHVIDEANDSIHFNVISFDGLISEWRFENNELKLQRSQRNVPSSKHIWLNSIQRIAYCSDSCGNISAYDLESFAKLYDLKPKLNEPIVHMEGDENYIISISSSHQLMIFDFLNVELLFPLERQLLVELRQKERGERIAKNSGNANNEDMQSIVTKQRGEGDQIRRQDLINRKTRTTNEESNNNNRSEVIIHHNTRLDEPVDKRPKSRLKSEPNGSTPNSTQKDPAADEETSGLVPTLISVGFLVLGFASFVVLRFVIKEQ